MLDPIYVDMNQSSDELLQLEQSAAAGQINRNASVTAKVKLELQNGTPYPIDGTLQFSEVTVDPNTGAVVLRATFPNPSRFLLPGMYVHATIIEGIDNSAILAPQQGVSRDERGEPTAFVVDGHGIARLRGLTVSRVVGHDWLVTKGLQAGDRLIVEGLLRVQADKPVHAVPANLAADSDGGR
jgi:membrane fusion protein (multidrug efflux system)